MRYRSRTDIVADILRIAQDGAIKTRIMYQAFLSFPQLKEYLALLTDAGLLSYLKAEKKYYTTKKGIHLLRMLDEVSGMLSAREDKAIVFEK